jgi:sulfur dioxygenase
MQFHSTQQVSVYEQVNRDIKQLQRLNLNLKGILETHVHADHISGAHKLYHSLNLKNIPIIHAQNSNVIIKDETPIHYVSEMDQISFGDRYLTVKETPGHTDHHLSFVMDDESLVLSGCSLYIGGCGRTDFQGGSSEAMFHSVMNKLYTLPDSCTLYPGHNYNGCLYSTIGEEKQHNERLFQGQTLEQFKNIMNNLKLPHPKLIHIAVPANLRGGIPKQ